MKMLEDLAEVVRALEMQQQMNLEKEFPTARYWSRRVDSLASSLIRTHHATIRDMAARLEAAQRDAKASAGLNDAADEYFNGDKRHLCRSIKALIALDTNGSLVPHGVGGHARSLLKACVHRLTGEKL